MLLSIDTANIVQKDVSFAPCSCAVLQFLVSSLRYRTMNRNMSAVAGSSSDPAKSSDGHNKAGSIFQAITSQI